MNRKKLIKQVRNEIKRRGLDVSKMPESELDKWVGFLVRQSKAKE